MSWNRRAVLKAGGILAGAMAGMGRALASVGSADAAAATDGAGARRIALVNLHTDERLDVEYFRGGRYESDALGRIETVLRDFRSGDRHPIDPALMDYLYAVAGSLGVDPVFSVISGYRSPQTNAQLHAKSNGVAVHSLHMQGRAIDVRVAGVDCAQLSAHALELKRGGVGYYRTADFVHLDTGDLRTWRG